MQYILQACNLVKHYPGVRAVDGVSFGVRPGQCLGLLGPNGAGKTTTVEIMEGIIPPTGGSVLYRGRPAGTEFRQHAGIQFQRTALQDFLTVRETLQMFHRLYDRQADLDEIIEDCALGNLLQRDNRRLSGGQRQRLLLAIALVNRPTVVFLDEPTTGLDPQARRNFWALVQRIKARDTTLILTTHYMEEAYVLCDDVAIMDAGRIIAQGSPEQLLKEHFNEVIFELPREDWPEPMRDFRYRVLEAGERVEFFAADVGEAIDALRAAGVNLSRLSIRARNLEDLFLELTGKELRA